MYIDGNNIIMTNYITTEKQREYQKWLYWEKIHLTCYQCEILTLAERKKLFAERENPCKCVHCNPPWKNTQGGK